MITERLAERLGELLSLSDKHKELDGDTLGRVVFSVAEALNEEYKAFDSRYFINLVLTHKNGN